MDAYLIFLFALPIAGLLYAIVVETITPKDFSAHGHPNAPPHPARPHR
jgi:hypothetical protein